MIPKIKTHWLAPLHFGGMVIVLGLVLLVIGARSPYTHMNLTPSYAAGYDRTQQTVVGPPWALTTGMVKPTGAKASLVSQGQALFFGLDCASCHGLKGQGGVFAPPIAGTDAQTIADKTSTGPSGMPQFTGLTNQDIQALAAYLKSVAPSAVAK